MSKPVLPKRYRKLWKRLKKQGWSWEITNGGHICFTGPNGEKQFASRTASDHRALKNLKSQLRNAGANI